MRRAIALAGLGLFSLALASDEPPSRTEGADGSRRQAEREVRELEAQFAQAVVRGDRAFFDRALADDFTHTSHSGVFKTRAQWLAESRSGEPTGAGLGTTRYDAFDVDDLEVRAYGDTAVVTGRTTPRGTTAKGQPMTGRYRFLRVWVKQQGRWRAVGFQGTRIAQP
jgi:ketosteroid isomerase-like protein